MANGLWNEIIRYTRSWAYRWTGKGFWDQPFADDDGSGSMKMNAAQSAFGAT